VDICNTSAADHYINFTSANSGTQRLCTDSGLQWKPSTNTLLLGNSFNFGKVHLRGPGAKILPDANGSTGGTPNANSGGNIGSATETWANVYATQFHGTATAAAYADLAENYLSDADYEPGTVLVFGGDSEVTICDSKGDRRAAGVVTTNPAHLMNSALQGDFVIGLALQGRVPCKVLGNVAKGDLLVTSAIPGYAIVDNDAKVGTVLGKSLENKVDDARGVIEIVIGRV
jgi:hypothetical protein